MEILLHLVDLDWLLLAEEELLLDKSKLLEGQWLDTLKGGNIWIRIFPDKPITKKPLEVRMGKGKGNVEYWVALVQPGKIMFEMAGVEEELAREAFRLASAKLPIKTHFIKKDL